MLAKERKFAFARYVSTKVIYLTIIPRARMGSELIAHEAEQRAEWAIDSEAMWARGIIVLVKSN